MPTPSDNTLIALIERANAAVEDPRVPCTERMAAQKALMIQAGIADNYDVVVRLDQGTGGYHKKVDHFMWRNKETGELFDPLGQKIGAAIIAEQPNGELIRFPTLQEMALLEEYMGKFSGELQSDVLTTSAKILQKLGLPTGMLAVAKNALVTSLGNAFSGLGRTGRRDVLREPQLAA